MMKHRKSPILLTFTLGAIAMVFSQIGDLRAAPPVPTDVVCFPSCSAVDGRFLVINQAGASPTIAGTTIDVEFSVSSTDTSFSWGIFDADVTGLWDDTTGAVLKYELFADPIGNGTGTFLVDSFTGNAAFLVANAGLVDNQWLDRPVNNVTYSANPAQSAQLSDSDNYHYHLRVSSTGANPAGGLPGGNSAFKVRTTGALGVAPQAFSYIGQLRTTSPAEVATIYPNSGGLTTGDLSVTTYDGSWDFSFFVPSGATQINLWDGDMDYGSRNCTTVQDTNDPDTPANYRDPSTGDYLTPWTNNTAPSGATNEGVALGGQTCNAGTGTGGSTGNPSDDANPITLRRSPSFGANVVYRLIGPDGTTAWDNLNGSGNAEWEKFTVDSDPATVFDSSKMDYKVADLPAGVYRTHVEGVDLTNLNAWYFSYRTLGMTPSGAPVPEDAFYSLSGTVFHDNDGDGDQNGSEQGVGSVAIVSIFASNGDFVARAKTLPDGSFSFRVASGNYFVVVEDSNFASGKPLNGYYSTTGGNSQAAIAPAAGATQDFGYRLAPVAVNDSYTAHKNTDLTVAAVGVQVNDTNVDNPGAALASSIVTGPSNGSVTLDPNGSFVYTPNHDFLGTDTFTYKVNDGAANSNIATVTITIVNDPPTARDDAYTTDENVTLTVVAPGILVNDSDPNGDALTLTIGATTTNGTLTPNANGSFVYVPNTGFVGVDTFTYTVSDGQFNSLSATVTITVVGHPPVAVDDSATTMTGTPVTITVLSNDSDPDHDTISVTSSTPPSNGSTVLNGDGTFTYTPNAGFFGVDTFTYTISDGHGGTSTATVTITVNKRTPTATATGGTFPYDGGSHPGTCTISDGLTGVLTYVPGGSSAPVNVGTYDVHCDFGGNDDFFPAHATSSITVTPLAADITAGGGTKVYGTGDPALSATTSSGFLAADLPGITLNSTRATGENVGNYATTPTATGGNVGNYTVVPHTGNFSITPATPTATATGGTFVYNGSPRPGTCTISNGLVGTLTYTPGGTSAPVAVGTYTVNCNYAGSLNYNPASATATITITPGAAPATGRMTGGGTIGDKKATSNTVTHGFTLHCNVNEGSNNLQVNWSKGEHFHLQQLQTASCTTDPTIKQAPPAAPFNTYTGTGWGYYNNTVKVNAKWVFTDAGEPGTKDMATLTLTNAATGQVVVTVTGNLVKGNQQAHK